VTQICVFLGPSLPIAEARAIVPDATYLPPAQMGDVLAALSERAAAPVLQRARRSRA
jgi:hypothetical protein